MTCPFCAKCYIDHAGNIYDLCTAHPDGTYSIDGDRVSIVNEQGEVCDTYVLHDDLQALLDLLQE